MLRPVQTDLPKIALLSYLRQRTKVRFGWIQIHTFILKKCVLHLWVLWVLCLFIAN